MKLQLVFATNNEHKLQEAKVILQDKVEILSLRDINCSEDIAETANTLEGNALIKAKYIFENYHINCFSDDTGLEIEALNNEPGVYSARYAGIDKNSEANMQKVLDKLKNTTNRKAQFRTAIALFFEGREYTFEGKVKGIILNKKHGHLGFGYDPIFQPLGYTQSFAEMPMNIKNKISHRGFALQKLSDFINTTILK